MKPIPPDFQPDERSYKNLERWIPLGTREVREFIDYELPHFITYWLELAEEARLLSLLSRVNPEVKKQAKAAIKKARKASWQMACQRWMRTAWTGQAGRNWEYDRHRRKWYNPKIAVNLPTASISIITPEQSIENFHKLENKFNLK